MKKCRFIRVENLKKNTVYWDEVKEIIEELEEENRKLKEECEENEYLVHDNARWMKRCEEKITEIKKLKAEKEILEHKVKFLEGIIELNKQLKEMGK